MSLTSFLAHIDRDARHQDRVSAGLRSAIPARDPRIIHWGCVHRYAFAVNPARTSAPDGTVVIAVRRDEHGRCHGLLIEAFEGNKADFATFRRVAHMLGATELQVCGQAGTILDRIIAVRHLVS